MREVKFQLRWNGARKRTCGARAYVCAHAPFAGFFILLYALRNLLMMLWTLLQKSDRWRSCTENLESFLFGLSLIVDHMVRCYCAFSVKEKVQQKHHWNVTDALMSSQKRVMMHVCFWVCWRNDNTCCGSTFPNPQPQSFATPPTELVLLDLLQWRWHWLQPPAAPGSSELSDYSLNAFLSAQQ